MIFIGELHSEQVIEIIGLKVVEKELTFIPEKD